VDLCFVSTAHEDTSRLPAVSGSSDRLVLCGHRRCDETQEEPTWPGRIVEDQAVDYADAMEAFVAASAPRLTTPLCLGQRQRDLYRRPGDHYPSQRRGS